MEVDSPCPKDTAAVRIQATIICALCSLLGADALAAPVPFHGRVIAPDGNAVRNFVMYVGPGDAPIRVECIRAMPQNANGEFHVEVPAEGKYWVGFKADGFAVWDGRVKVEHDAPSFVIQLEQGVRVTGRLQGYSDGLGLVKVRLVPHRKKVGLFLTPPQSRLLATLTTIPSAEGVFEFPNVRPDNYTLDVDGSRVASQPTVLAVDEAGPLSLRVDLAPLGQVEGHIQKPPRIGSGPAASCRGEIVWSNGEIENVVPFKTDKDGHFQVANIPSGRIRVRIRYCISNDICVLLSRQVQVQPSATTEVQLAFGSNSRWDVPVDLTIGDGTEAQFQTGAGLGAARKVKNVTTLTPGFNFEFEPAPGQSVSWPSAWEWESIESSELNRVTIHDVHPGRYRLRVGCWMGSRGFHSLLHTLNVETHEGMEPIQVSLGGGSITGRILSPEDAHRVIRVVAARVDGDVDQRTAYSDHDGNFCIQYLAPGRYVLYAHDHRAGWKRLGVRLVNNDTSDVGEHSLDPGATIEVRVRLQGESDVPDAILATDQNGITIEATDPEILSGQDYRIDNLWPSEWEVSLRSGDRSLATKRLVLLNTQTVTCDLVND